MTRVSLATQLAAVAMGGNTVFGDLKPDDRFHFPRHPHVTYAKDKGGWYHRVSGVLAYPPPKFRTGPGTAVVKHTEEPPKSPHGCPKCHSGDWKLAEGGIAYCGACGHVPPGQQGY